jgi:hypothetical protein
VKLLGKPGKSYLFEKLAKMDGLEESENPMFQVFKGILKLYGEEMAVIVHSCDVAGREFGLAPFVGSQNHKPGCIFGYKSQELDKNLHFLHCGIQGLTVQVTLKV